MENFHDLKWAYNGTPIPEEEKLSFYYSFSNLDIKAKDILFCHLNEIEPDLIDLIDEDQDLAEENQFEQIIDPRNEQIIDNLTIDFSDKARFRRKSFIFNNFPQLSTLTKEEHIGCVRFLCAKRDRKVPRVEDVKIFEHTKEKRENEYKVYIEFVKNYVLANPSNSFKELEDLYRNKLKYFTEKLNQLPNETFSLQTALPILGNISVDSKINYECCPNFIQINGSFPKYKECYDLYKIRLNLKNYLNNLNEFIANPLFHIKNQDNLNYDLKISEQALLLLLETSNNLSSEFEIPFEIGSNSIEIAQPLPSRFSNLKTNLNVFEIVFRNFLSCHHTQSFIEYKNGKLSVLNNENDEIDAVDLNQSYKPKTLDEFSIIDNGKLKSSILNSKLVFNDSDKNLNVIINFQNVGFLNNDNEMINLSCKLEYKKKFGLEKMTLNELLTEYVRANFIPNISTVRHHIDVDTFELIHSSNITKSEIFNEILELYQINMANLINKFYEFINMLRNFPEGKYILKYEKKFKDKFIIYSQKNLENSKIFTIKSLFEISGLNVQNDFITIDNKTCVKAIHERLRIVPGCFPPYGGKKGRIIRNDREKIVEKAQTKKVNMIKQLESKKKKRKRIAKKLRKREKKKQKLENDLMSEEDINYTNQLIEKYAKVETLKCSSDYVSIKQNSEIKTVEAKEDFSLEKYLSDAASSSGTQTSFTREDYLEFKRAKNPKILNSSEIALRKAK